MNASMPGSMYRTLYEHGMDAVFLTAPDGRIFAANPAACEMFRMTETQICRLGRAGLVDEDDAAFHAYLAERARYGKARSELTFIRGDGSRFIGEVSSAQFTDDAGELRTALIVRDLSERKRVEMALIESEERYRSVVNAMAEGAVFQQADGRIVAANPAAEKILGRTAENLMGMTSEDASWSAIREDGSPFPGHEHPVSLALRNGDSQRDIVMGIRVGDALRWLSINAEPVFDGDDGRPKAAVVTFHDITERKQAEEALRDSEQRYRTIFENSPIGLFRSALDGRYIEANPALAHIFGYETPEALIRDIHDIGKQLYIDEADRQRVVARQMQAPGDSALHLNRYRRRDGTECIANLYLKTIRDKEGRPIFFEGIVEDVTESKRAEEGLRTSEARFRTFVDHVSDGLFLHGEHGIILDVNRQACLNLGYSREELIGMGPAQFDAYLSPDARVSIDKQIIKGEVVTFESYHRRKDGSTFPVEVSIRPFMDGDRRVQVSSARDITERKRAEDELHASEVRFRIFVDHAMDAFFVHGENGIVIDVNRQACQSLGYSRDELIGMSPAQFDADLSDDFRESMRNRVKQGEVMTFTSRHRRKDGSTFPVEVSVRSFPYGARILQISTARDISERLRVEGDLRRLNRELQVKTEELDSSNRQLRRLTAHREEIREQERMSIARNVHDELGQLLTALQMKLSMLALGFGKDNKPLSKEIKATQALADKSLKAARDVISALRPATLDMGLAVSLEWLAQHYTADTGIACDVRLIDCQDEPVNEAAIIALYRIAQESLTNIARHAHADQANIVLSGLDGACQLIVRDNGRGFDPEGIKEDSFGLIGIRERVAMLGGVFAIDSRKGKGTELRVTIPVSMQQEAL